MTHRGGSEPEQATCRMTGRPRKRFFFTTASTRKPSALESNQGAVCTLAPGDLPRSTVWNKPKTRPILAIRQHDRLLQVTLQRSGGGRGRQKLERLHRVPRARRVPAGALRGLSPRRRAPPRRLDLFVERHQLGEAARVPLPPRPPRLGRKEAAFSFHTPQVSDPLSVCDPPPPPPPPEHNVSAYASG